MEQSFRRELKYEIPYGEYMQLQPKLRQIMQRDSHAGESGSYLIKSLYFDNCYDKALHEKLSGVKNRDKYRIRCYNNDYSYIVLEKKSKRNNLCLKKACTLTREDCEGILNGFLPEENGRELITDFKAAYASGLMRPKTLVVYNREAFTYKAGNVRITFDSDIRTGLYHSDFFDDSHPLIPAIGKGRMILEIKYDEYLPDIIRHIIQCGTPRIQAFSKYAACRQYE